MRYHVRHLVVPLLLSLCLGCIFEDCENSSSPGDTTPNPIYYALTPQFRHALRDPGDIRDFWVAGPGQLYVAAYNGDTGGILAQFDGANWTPLPQPPVHPKRMLAFSQSDIWLAGSKYTGGPSVAHFDGTDWTIGPDAPGGTYDIWGTSSGDLYAVNESGVHHFDGTQWTLAQEGRFRCVWGSGSDDVFAGTIGGGSWGLMFHFDGSTWESTEMRFSGRIPHLFSIWGTSPNDVYAVGGESGTTQMEDGAVFHYDGASWTAIRESSGDGMPLRVWGRDANTVYVVGSRGLVWFFDGSQWETIGDDPNPSANLTAIVSDETIGLYAAGYIDSPNWTNERDIGRQQYLQRFLPFQWHEITALGGQNLHAVWGSSENDVFASGTSNTLLHYDGSTWLPMSPPASTGGLNGIWGSGPDNVYVVGGENGLGRMIRYTGGAWNDVTIPDVRELIAIHGTAADNIYAVGVGSVLHFDGSTWTDLGLGTGLQPFVDVWTYNNGDVYIAGPGTQSLFFNGATSQWEPLQPGLVALGTQKVSGTEMLPGLYSMWVLGFDGIYARRSNDDDWFKYQFSETNVDFPEDVWAAYHDFIVVYVAGAQGQLSRYDVQGNVWKAGESSTVQSLGGLWGLNSGLVMCGGNAGTLLFCHDRKLESGQQ